MSNSDHKEGLTFILLYNPYLQRITAVSVPWAPTKCCDKTDGLHLLYTSALQ